MTDMERAGARDISTDDLIARARALRNQSGTRASTPSTGLTRTERSESSLRPPKPPGETAFLTDEHVHIDRLESLGADDLFPILLFARLRDMVEQEEPRDLGLMYADPMWLVEGSSCSTLVISAGDPFDFPQIGADFSVRLLGNSERRYRGLRLLTKEERDLLRQLGWMPPKDDIYGRGYWFLVPEEDSAHGLFKFVDQLVETFAVWEADIPYPILDIYRHPSAAKDGAEVRDWQTKEDERMREILLKVLAENAEKEQNKP